MTNFACVCRERPIEEFLDNDERLDNDGLSGMDISTKPRTPEAASNVASNDVVVAKQSQHSRLERHFEFSGAASDNDVYTDSYSYTCTYVYTPIPMNTNIQKKMCKQMQIQIQIQIHILTHANTCPSALSSTIFRSSVLVTHTTRRWSWSKRASA